MSAKAKKIQKPSLSKGESIVEAARKLFLREGFAGTSVDAIALEAGVSKATVYAHFENKEGLFGEAMTGLCRGMGGLDVDEGLPEGCPEEGLKFFAKRVLTPVLRPEVIAAFRTMIAQSGNFPELGALLCENGLEKWVNYLAAYLAEQTKKGLLRVENPKLAANQFIGLVQGTIKTRALLGAGKPLGERQVNQDINHAVKIFLHGTAAQ